MVKVRTSGRRCGIALAGLLAATTAPALAQYPQGATVQQLPNADDPAELLAGALRTLAVEPNNVAALVTAGHNALTLGDPNAAVGFFGRASELAPRDGRVKAGLGSALVQLEKPQDALRLFGEASALGVPDVELAEDRGLAYDLTGDNRRAQADYSTVLATRPDDDTARRRLALSQGIAGNKAAALATLDPLIRKRDIAGWRAQTFVLAMNGDAAGAGYITHIMMPQQADMLQPFLVRLPSLTPAEKARAVHFGEMPQAGKAYTPTQLANTGAPATYASRPAPTPKAERRRSVEVASAQPAATPTTTSVEPAPTAPAPTTLAPALRAPTPAPTPLPAPVSPRAPVAPEPSPSRVAVTTAPVTPAPAPQVASVAPERQATVVAGPLAPAVAQRAASPVPQPSPPVQTALVSNPAPLAAMAFATETPATTPSTTSGIAPAGQAVVTGAGPASPATSPAPSTAAPMNVASAIATAPSTATVQPAMPSPSIAALPAPASGAGHFDLPHDAAAPAVREPIAKPTVVALPKEEAKPARKTPPDRAPAPATEVAVADTTSSAKGRKGASTEHDAAPRSDDTTSRDKHGRKRDAAPSDEDTGAKSKSGHSGKHDDVEPDSARKTGRKGKSESAQSDESGDSHGKSDKGRGKSAAKDEGGGENVYVQVAGGANRDDMDKAWSRVKEKAPDLMKGHSPSTTPLKATNRLLVGPFKDEKEAQAFVNKMAGKGLSGFTFKSGKGQKIDKIDAGK